MSSSMEVSVLPLARPGSVGRTWRSAAAGLLMLLALGACGGQAPGPASGADQSASATTTVSDTCQPAGDMGRPCQNADRTSEEAEEYGGRYRDSSNKQCEHYLAQSFQAFKACVRY
jgi:hypothetical protein